jgi:alkanesulfonate monooxygenase SsuD/methylene tetrahydromethanopterin reductase-like flavin-dependent oxidoreductase (luciferase family)
MKFGIDTPHFGPFGDASLLADLAYETEQSGWDGFFIWDHMMMWEPAPMVDPWIALALVATRTKRIRFGAMVTPVARRHPWKLARETVTLDRISGGRLLFGAGLGTDLWGEMSAFGTPTDDRARAASLDEGLEILTGLWTGKPFSFSGHHFDLKEVQFLPAPVQSPRIPIWIGGAWPKARRPFRRAARFDGVIPITGDLNTSLTPSDLRAMSAYIKLHRTSTAPFDIVCSGQTPGISREQDRAIAAPLAQAGATWFLESASPFKSFDDFRARLRQGPPQL